MIFHSLSYLELVSVAFPSCAVRAGGTLAQPKFSMTGVGEWRLHDHP